MTPKRRSIIFIHPSDEVYGADRMLLEQLAAVPREVEVEVWLPNDLKHPHLALCSVLEESGVRTRHIGLPILRRAYRTPRGFIGLLRRAVTLYRQLRVASPDMVYCTTSAASLGAPVARAARVRVVYGHVQEIWTESDRRRLGLVMRSCHRIVCVSRAAVGAMPPGLRGRAVVVENGTQDPHDFVPLEGRRGPLNFVIASRWNLGKGYNTLLKAWNDVPEGRLLVLGGPPLSGGITDVPALVRALARPESVDIVGEVDDPAPYLSAADVVLVPSDYPEGFGLVVIEGFAHGRPTVSSAAGGILDIVTDGEDGWLFPPGDANALAAVLRALDRDLVERAGARARVAYENRYTSTGYAHRWRIAAGLE